MKPPLWARAVGAVLFGGIWPTHVHGADLVPPSGPVLLASNHVGFLDGPMLFAVAPRTPRCLVKRELFGHGLGWLLRAMRQIPVDRSGVDRAAMTTALEILASGDVVGVFPEGTRGRGDGAEVKQGIAWLALRSGSPVVPVACLGTRRTGESPHGLPRPRRHLDVVFGAPLQVTAAPGVTGRAALGPAAEKIRVALAAHVAGAVRLTGQHLPDETKAVSIDRGTR